MIENIFLTSAVNDGVTVCDKHFSLSEGQQSDFYAFTWKIVLGLINFFYFFKEKKELFLHDLKVDTIISKWDDLW